MQVPDIAWPEDGLLPVVIVDARTNDVLTLAYANRSALKKTLSTRETHLYSRTRKAQWRKGETSGNTQHVVAVDVDCDRDALIYRVIPTGPACHTGADSCFSRAVTFESTNGTTDAGAFMRAVAKLPEIIESRRGADPEKSYVAKLYARGIDWMLKKMGEEATEVVIAAKNADHKEIVWEVADLLFHVIVVLSERGVTLDEVGAELMRRHAVRAQRKDGASRR